MLPSVLAPLRDRPGDTALFVDYDGTLAPIVDDPAGARPVEGVREVLAGLGRRLAMVVVVSGRPATYLRDHLGTTPGVHLAGLYGMEEVTAEGGVHRSAAAAGWEPVVTEVARRASAAAPPGLEVEPKGLSVTLHWRRAPEAEAWATATARREASATGLALQPGRMAVELRPPTGADKGTVVAALGAGHAVVGYFGDDLGDLPAFDVLATMALGGTVVARVAVSGGDSPPAVAAAADLVVDGPSVAVELLRLLAAA
ncbi:MAG: trehalose-phosphatase [Acidimicrobiales bacterium]